MKCLSLAAEVALQIAPALGVVHQVEGQREYPHLDGVGGERQHDAGDDALLGDVLDVPDLVAIDCRALVLEISRGALHAHAEIAHQLVVQAVAVLEAAVLPELLAMV